MTEYDRIGIGYAGGRRADPRIAEAIEAALDGAERIVNIGAGTGSYEPAGRQVLAVEPSAAMIAQRAPGAAPVIRAIAEDLPFANDHFDAAMAVLTIHHWTDPARGVAEMRRVTRGPLVFLSHDPDFRDFWLYDYFPDLPKLDDGRMPRLSDFRDWLGDVRITEVAIPRDCEDGFLAAFWARPHAYLDPAIRAGMSSFWMLGDITGGLARLRADLESGAWEKRYGHLLNQAARDCGYRLVVAPAPQ